MHTVAIFLNIISCLLVIVYLLILIHGSNKQGTTTIRESFVISTFDK